MAYWAHLVVSVSMYFVLALGLRFFSTKTGTVSLMHAAFMALGAYVNALVLTQGVAAPAGWLIGAAFAALFAFVVSGTIFRARGDFFAVLTISLQLAVVAFLMNAQSLTNGPLGISNIPSWPFDRGPWWNVVLFSSLAIAFVALFVWLERSLWSTSLVAISDNEMLMQSLGYDTLGMKKSALALSAGVCGFVGALFAQYISYVDPTAFELAESILILTIVVIAQRGGILSLFGASLVVVALPELLRFMPSEWARSANLREIVYAGILASVLLVRHYNSRAPSND